MKFCKSKFSFVLCITLLITISGCSGSSDLEEEDSESQDHTQHESKVPVSESEAERKGNVIIETARSEQQNEMYSNLSDSVFQYWTNVPFYGAYSKCNIFALNVLYKAGCRCPTGNVTTYDLMDTTRFNDILPIIKPGEDESLVKGDLIIWNGHVIIFESYTPDGKKDFVLGWWGGSRQQNNATDVINDVAHGKYPLREGYIVRRPIK